jgi:mRNA interferase MazF
VVVASLTGDDVLLCQITSKAIADTYAIPLEADDFADGGVHQASNIRPNRLFTAEGNIILYRAGSLASEKMKEVTTKIIEIISA